MTKIIILDPDSSDPTWGTMEDALIIEITENDLDCLMFDDGEVTIQDVIKGYGPNND